MTQQRFVQEFRSYPKAKQFEIICELTKFCEEDLKKHIPNGHKLSTDDEEAIYLLGEITSIDLKSRLTEDS